MLLQSPLIQLLFIQVQPRHFPKMTLLILPHSLMQRLPKHRLIHLILRYLFQSIEYFPSPHTLPSTRLNQCRTYIRSTPDPLLINTLFIASGASCSTSYHSVIHLGEKVVRLFGALGVFRCYVPTFMVTLNIQVL